MGQFLQICDLFQYENTFLYFPFVPKYTVCKQLLS